MKRNVGKNERLARLAVGSVLLGLGAWRKKWLGALGGIPLVTGLIKYCPVNEMLGINVIKNKHTKKNSNLKVQPVRSTADKSFHFSEKQAEGEDDTGGYRTGKARKLR